MDERIVRWLSIALALGLVIWGGYGLLYYLHVPVHQMVLMADVDRLAIDASCGMESVFCRGFQALGPFFSQFFVWMSPLGGYIVTCLVLFLLIGGGYALMKGRWTLRWTITPLRVFGIFLLILWLLFTAMSFGTSDGQPVRRVFEPTPEVYDVGPEALETLRENFNAIEAAGCLRQAGVTVTGAGIYTLNSLCIQGAFFTRVLPHVLVVVLLLLAFLTVGKTLLGFLRVRPKTLMTETAFSAGLGACAYVVLLWLLAVLGVLTMIAGWIVMIVPVLLCYPSLLAWLRRAKDTRWSKESVLWSLGPIIAWILLTYIALNFLNVLRPFPIGWDDLGSYLNRPRLMVSYGHFISTMSPFQWEYLTSLGFLLFGYDSAFGAVMSMMVNWTAGLLAILAVIAFVRAFNGTGGILAALLYYALPLVGHFSFADMKVDNAVFAMGSLSLLAGFLALFPPRTAEPESEPDLAPRQDLALMVLAGIFAGFAFAMKSTAIMVIFALLGVAVGATLHWSAFAATVLFAWGIYANRGVFTLADVLRRAGLDGAVSNVVFVWTLFAAAALLFAWAAWSNRSRFALAAKRIAVFIAAAALTVLPWVMHNNLLRGNIIPHFELAAPNLVTPTFNFTGKAPNAIPPPMRILPTELIVDVNGPLCKATGAKEELDRYWGYSDGWSHYLTLPWRTVMNVDSSGYYVTTMAALLLFPLLLFVPRFWRREEQWMRWLFAATAFIVLEWMFLANGIPWYGVGMFLGLCIALEILIVWAPNRATKIAAGLLIAMSLLTCFSQRMWQFHQQQNLFEYPLGKVSAEAMRERTIPHYDDIHDIIMSRAESMPERPYVYRVGTFIPYFIPRNPEIIALTDNQLDTFNCLYQERDAALTLQRLQELGFNSIIFDTNTSTIERDPQGSLHQKVDAFVNFLNRADLGMQVVIYDPGGGIAYVLLP